MVAAIGALGAVAGGAISASGAKSAAGAQSAAASNALNYQVGTYEGNQKNINPFVVGGQGAQQTLNNDLYSNGSLGGSFNSAPYGGNTFTPQDFLNNQDPGYQFQLQQGQQALQNSQSAQDGVLSGSALKGLINYNQGAASTGYQNAYNRWLGTQQNGYNQWLGQQQNTYGQLQGLAALGSNAAVGAGTNAVNSANGAASSATNIGNAQASGDVGAANAASSAVSNGAGYYALNSLLGNGNNSDTGANGQNNPANQAGLDSLMNSYA